jgi:hypothetical protein
METAKQLAPDVFFKAAYVTTYRRLRYVQLTGGLGKTQTSRSRLEGTQCKQGRWALCRHWQ